MRPQQRFLQKSKSFWACVRTLSQHIGYSSGNHIIAPSIADMADGFRDLGLSVEAILNGNRPTDLAVELHAYFEERARALEDAVRHNLMDAVEAAALYQEMDQRLRPSCPQPMNKQKGEKRAKAYLTCIVNMLVEENAQGFPCDYDPRELTTITQNGLPLRTLARRVDGAFTSPLNPVAVWEIKEYYYTTSFGSRIADGVYESLLDGLELEEVRDSENIDVKHYLMVDARDTWWDDGKSYLCRIFDMLHMGSVDEVLFGREVVTELPRIVGEWVAQLRAKGITPETAVRVKPVRTKKRERAKKSNMPDVNLFDLRR